MALATLAVAPTTALAAEQTITSAGPLEEIIIGDELNCQVQHADDTVFAFYEETTLLGDCGTFVAYNTDLYAPSQFQAASFDSTDYTLVSQSAVAGTGSLADPFRIVTVVDAGTDLRITQTDSYVVGQESYRTDIQLTNLSDAPLAVNVYRAGDCFLQDSDDGFGGFNAVTGAVSCVAPVIPDDETSGPGDRIIEWFPISPGSSHYEASFDEVWGAIDSQAAFPGTCECDTFQDNGAGLSWTLNLTAGGTASVSHLTTFAPLGVAPLVATKTADAATSAPGAPNGYTITITNPNAGSIALDTITDTLPAGFAYVTGSSTGVTTANPVIAGQNLTWSGPFAVPANGSIMLHFNVTVSATPGTHTNQAGGTATGTTVTPSGPTAPITVAGAAVTTPTPTATPTGAPPPNTASGGSGNGSTAVLTLAVLAAASLGALAAANARISRARRR
jgi:uncharacterized repeat protein (TIGR01451 family)